MTAIRPMLGVNAPKDLSTLHYPMYLSPKLDGVRAIVKDGVVYHHMLDPETGYPAKSDIASVSIMEQLR